MREINGKEGANFQNEENYAIIDACKDILLLSTKKTDVENRSSESKNELEILQMTYL